MAQESGTSQNSPTDGEDQRSWWQRLLEKMGYQEGPDNDTGFLGAIRNVPTINDLIGYHPGPNNDTGMIGRLRGNDNAPAPIFSDGMENGNQNSSPSNSPGRAQHDSGPVGGWTDSYYADQPNSPLDSMYESIFASNERNGEQYVGGGERAPPTENVGGGGIFSPYNNPAPSPDGEAPGTEGGTPYQRRPLNIPSIAQALYPQFSSGGPPINSLPFIESGLYSNHKPEVQTINSLPFIESGLYSNRGREVQSMPNFQSQDFPQYGGDPSQIYRGGQNPSLSRYRPQTFDFSGKPTNGSDQQGGYSYNLPNSFGPFPQFNSNYGGGFNGMWGGEMGTNGQQSPGGLNYDPNRGGNLGDGRPPAYRQPPRDPGMTPPIMGQGPGGGRDGRGIAPGEPYGRDPMPNDRRGVMSPEQMKEDAAMRRQQAGQTPPIMGGSSDPQEQNAFLDWIMSFMGGAPQDGPGLSKPMPIGKPGGPTIAAPAPYPTTPTRQAAPVVQGPK